MRVRLALVVALVSSLLSSSSFAESPSHGADANIYFERRGDASGGAGDGMVRPSLFTGAATMSVPIEVPRGTGGIEPGLALGYNSLRGRAEAGVGWDLSLPAIRRSTKYGTEKARQFRSTVAIFEMGGEELVRSTTLELDPYGCNAVRYYSKVETHQKILLCTIDDANEYWVVHSKDGSFATYGKTSSARAEYIDATLSSSRIFEWALEARTNAHGVSWRAIYTKTGEWPRLDAIRYALLNVFGTETTIGDLREVDVVWQTRSDKVVDYRYGIQRVLQHRISDIVVNFAGVRVRRYALTYDASPDTTSSRLRSVQQLGILDADSLPAQTFDY